MKNAVTASLVIYTLFLNYSVHSQTIENFKTYKFEHSILGIKADLPESNIKNKYDKTPDLTQLQMDDEQLPEKMKQLQSEIVSNSKGLALVDLTDFHFTETIDLKPEKTFEKYIKCQIDTKDWKNYDLLLPAFKAAERAFYAIQNQFVPWTFFACRVMQETEFDGDFFYEVLKNGSGANQFTGDGIQELNEAIQKLSYRDEWEDFKEHFEKNYYKYAHKKITLPQPPFYRSHVLEPTVSVALGAFLSIIHKNRYYENGGAPKGADDALNSLLSPSGQFAGLAIPYNAGPMSARNSLKLMKKPDALTCSSDWGELLSMHLQLGPKKLSTLSRASFDSLSTLKKANRGIAFPYYESHARCMNGNYYGPMNKKFHWNDDCGITQKELLMEAQEMKAVLSANIKSLLNIQKIISIYQKRVCQFEVSKTLPNSHVVIEENVGPIQTSIVAPTNPPPLPKSDKRNWKIFK